MQRIETLLQKVMEMSARGSKNTAIDIDLMMDYVKVVYADLLEMRARAVYTSDMPQTAPAVEQVAPEQLKTSSVISTITPEPIAETTMVAPEVIVAEEPTIEETLIATEEEPETAIKKEELPKEETVVEAPPTYNFPVKHDIRKVIGINDKYTFISELFGNDKEAYEKTLDEISGMASLDEALEWTKENMLFTDDADGQNETAQLFYDTLNRFFSER